MVEVVLYQPEIPPNTGNVIRLCANTGTPLHLVEPLGFSVDDRQLRRAGLDYHELASMRVHPDWLSCKTVLAGRRLFAFTTRSARLFQSVAFAPGDVFVFGRRRPACRMRFWPEFRPDRRVRLPMVPGNRSLNLSNAVAVAVYEAWRRAGISGGG